MPHTQNVLAEHRNWRITPGINNVLNSHTINNSLYIHHIVQKWIKCSRRTVWWQTVAYQIHHHISVLWLEEKHVRQCRCLALYISVYILLTRYKSVSWLHIQCFQSVLLQLHNGYYKECVFFPNKCFDLHLF